MDIEEILALRSKLEDEILNTIQEFENKAKVHVDNISLVEQQAMGRKYLRTGGVTCRVEL